MREPVGIGARDLVAVGAAALLLRLAHLAELRRSPFWDVLLGDAAGYVAWAERLAAGDWLGHEVFYQAPLYPYLLGLLFALFDADAAAARLLQAGLGATSAVAVALAGARAVGRGAGIAAGLAVAGLAPAIFYDALLEKSSLTLLLSAGLLALLVTPEGAELTARRTAVAGAVLGLLALTRENALGLAVVLVGWLALGRGARPSRRARRAAALGLAFCAVLAPVALRNLAVGGEPWPTTAQLGPNFWIGNHAGATGRYLPLRPGGGSSSFERGEATLLAEVESGRSLSPGEVSAYWLARALDDVRREPARWLALTARKARLTVHRDEIMDSEAIEAHREISRVLRLLAPLDFGLLWVLAAAGAVTVRARWRALAPLWLLLGFALAGVVAFFVLGRYRVVCVPPLAVLAGAAIAEGPRALATARPLARLAGASLVALAAAVAYLPLDATPSPRAVTRANLAGALLDRGDLEGAIAEARRALELAPRQATAAYHLGTALARAGRDADAIEALGLAVTLVPDHAPAQLNLGLVLARRGRTSDAVRALHAAVHAAPERPEPRTALGDVYARGGDAPAAITAYREALARAPGHLPALVNLGLVFARLERDGEAAECWEAALRLRPDHPGVRRNLAMLRTRRARPGRCRLARGILPARPRRRRGAPWTCLRSSCSSWCRSCSSR